MPAIPPDPKRAARHDGPATIVTEFDPLSTPFDERGGVDLLLDDLAPAQPAQAALLTVLTPSTGAPAAATRASERTAHRAAVASRRSGGGRAVLVVDSSAIARKFLMQRLDGLGYAVRGAATGEEALALIARNEFAVVFLEFVLGPKPGLDGLGLCQAIKQNPDHPRGLIPAVVMVTGRVGSSDRVRGALAGCDAYLTKPLAEAAFVATLTEVDPLFK